MLGGGEERQRKGVRRAEERERNHGKEGGGRGEGHRESQNLQHIINLNPSMPTKHIQNGVSGSCTDAIFESEIWTSLSHTFTKGGLLQLSG